MASNFSSEPLSYNLILLGKTGSGKSASGNTILGRTAFLSKKSFKSVTQAVQMESVTLDGVTMNVYDTPGLFNTETCNDNIKRKWRHLLTLDQSARSVFLMVIKATRFTPEEKQAIHLMEEFLPKSLLQFTWVLFSRGDELEREDLTIHRFIDETPGIKEVLQRLQSRYHVFNNVSPNPHQVPQLVQKIRAAAAQAHVEMEKSGEEKPSGKASPDLELRNLSELRIVVLGKNLSENSSVANIILGTQAFITEHHLHSEEQQSLRVSRYVKKRYVTIINTPPMFNPRLSQEELSKRIKECVSLSDPGPHAFLLVVRPHDFTEKDRRRLRYLLNSFSDQAVNYCILTRSDSKNFNHQHVSYQRVKKLSKKTFLKQSLENENQSVDQLIKEIDQIVTKNGGVHVTCEVFEDVQEEHASARRRGKETKRLPEERKDKMGLMESVQQKGISGLPSTAKRLKQQFTQNQTAGLQPKLEVLEKRKKSSAAHESAEDGSIEEEEKKFEQLLIRINLNEKYKQKMKMSDVLQISWCSLFWMEPCKEKQLVETFLQRIVMGDYRARYITAEEDSDNSEHTHLNTEEEEEDGFADFFLKKSVPSNREAHKSAVHPMDVQLALFLCSDNFLKQLIANKLAQCQYALPLLVPNPFSRKIEFPLWTFRQIRKSWKTTGSSGEISKTQAMSEAETTMVAFYRLGSAVSSKSQLMNSLINEKHQTFFHRHCPGSSRNRLLLDGVVEITWYCPSGEETDYFSDCVAFCNLHGDAVTHTEQLEILTERSSVNVVLLTDPGKATYQEILQKLYRDTKPLICLLSEDDSGVTKTRKGKYRIGLKDRNQSEVAKNLRMTIKECLSKSPPTFRIEDLHKPEMITKDEEDPECKRGRKAAETIMKQLEGSEVSKLKEKFLPCQGKLWHDWCEMNKDLHRLHGNNLEMQKSEKQSQMKEIRGEQHKYRMSGLLEAFTSSLNRLAENERVFFVKWLGILLDKRTSDDLSDLHHKYNQKWTSVLDLKKKRDKSDQMKTEQKQLEEISEELNAATFGLEHIFREMGQIYESFISQQTPEKCSKGKTLTSLPKLAAELMKSGHPLELMDGDAAHVPLIWVSAVLDELVKILGDKKVFVLSVLGIQSSGKSTMLNAMFGLQFAVSAGRCTRGAFMQLVSVSEEMKKELKFDYILIVDTEGLRALELTGKSTRHHDNELATFVVGLGNLTLINIFGENPAEMQDILQIVVQAFLRMKKVQFHPSCLFVHQNVGDITAGEQNMEGKRRLQEKLDEMTKLAAKEEDIEADGFSDVIEFDVQNDVYYFAQLWEGSPPMAPPNPSYSRNIQDLKKAIFRKASRFPGITLSQFKARIRDLWNALLNENFVFSFRNTLEIAVYRKLEQEFRKWTWNLRSAMLAIKENLYNRIEYEKLEKIGEEDLYSSMKKTKEEVDNSMKSYFEEDEDKDILVQWKVRCDHKITRLYEDLVKDTKLNLNEVIQQQKTQATFELQSTQNYETKLFNLSKELALKLKSKITNKQTLEKEFNTLWDRWVSELTQDTPPERTFCFWGDAVRILSLGNERAFVSERKSLQEYRQIANLFDYSVYISNLRRQKAVHYIPGMNKLSFKDNNLIRTLVIDVIKEAEGLINKICKKITRVGYKDSYIQEVTAEVRVRVEQHHNEKQRIKLNKMFTLDLCLHVCELMSHSFTEHHQKFRAANDPRVYLSKKKPQYYSVFNNYCRGATTTTVFGELICSNLRESILQAVYNTTAIGLVSQISSDMPEFNGNRSNLEKHILKYLAEEENFEKYMEYIHNPKKHFENFIREKVQKYITENSTVLKLFRANLQEKKQKVQNAVLVATEEVKSSSGDADAWLRSFSASLKGELSFKEITFTDLQEITDFNFLQKLLSDGITDITSELDKNFTCVKDIKMEKFRKKPDEILIEQLIKCCWTQCPFCNAICTNTMENHAGNHSVPFHRVKGVKGMSYSDTTFLTSDFCTTAVQSDKSFYPRHNSDVSVPFKSYRTAGGVYETWSITPDNSELAYWKWFVCRFQKDLEKHHKKTFDGSGEIPREWRVFTRAQAIASLDEYI